MINIIGGFKKRTKLDVINKIVRPTSSYKREAIFAILESKAKKNDIEIYQKKCFLDLYAGSGSVGLEAISRGIEFSFFFERKKEIIDVLKKNCDKICLNKNYKIINNIDDFAFENINYPISAIFIDPPYNLKPFENLLKKFLNLDLITKETFIIIESEKKTKIIVPKKLKIFDTRIYGKTKISFLSLKESSY